MKSFLLLHSKLFINELEKNIKAAFQPVGHKLTTLKPNRTPSIQIDFIKKVDKKLEYQRDKNTRPSEASSCALYLSHHFWNRFGLSSPSTEKELFASFVFYLEFNF